VKWKRTELYSSGVPTRATYLPPLTPHACLPPIHLLLKVALVLLWKHQCIHLHSILNLVFKRSVWHLEKVVSMSVQD